MGVFTHSLVATRVPPSRPGVTRFYAQYVSVEQCAECETLQSGLMSRCGLWKTRKPHDRPAYNLGAAIRVRSRRSPPRLCEAEAPALRMRAADEPWGKTPSLCRSDERFAHIRIPPGRSPEGASAPEGSCPARECGAGYGLEERPCVIWTTRDSRALASPAADHPEASCAEGKLSPKGRRARNVGGPGGGAPGTRGCRGCSLQHPLPAGGITKSSAFSRAGLSS